jgi:hypothetical protein
MKQIKYGLWQADDGHFMIERNLRHPTGGRRTCRQCANFHPLHLAPGRQGICRYVQRSEQAFSRSRVCADWYPTAPGKDCMKKQRSQRVSELSDTLLADLRAGLRIGVLARRLNEVEWRIVELLAETGDRETTAKRVLVTRARVRFTIRKCRRILANKKVETPK